MVGPALIPIAIKLASAFAPTLLSKLAGDGAGEVAREVVSVAQDLTGADDPDSALSSLNTDPSLALEFKHKMGELEVRLSEAYLKDRQDARDRDIKLRELGYRNVRADVMLVVAGVALIADIAAIALVPDMKPAVLAIVNMMVGAILKMLGDAFHFEFGSSRGSKEKDLR